jgi:hypothetical protein
VPRTLEVGALDHADARPAAQRRAFRRQAGRNCPKVLGQVRHCQAGLFQYGMQPSKTDVGLEGILARVALALDCRKQRGDDLREAVGGGRGSSRGSLRGEGCYLRLGACCEGEAWMRR